MDVYERTVQIASWITMNNLIPTLLLLYLHIYKVQSKVGLSGYITGYHITFTCNFSIGSHDCSAEFLRNNQTIDNLRASHNNCFHKAGLCAPTVCSCSMDCKQYVLIYSTIALITGQIFGCKVDYKNAGYTHTMTSEILFNGTEFLDHKNYSDIVAQPEGETSTPELPVLPKNHGTTTLIAIGFSLLGCFIVSVIWYIIKKAILQSCVSFEPARASIELPVCRMKLN